MTEWNAAKAYSVVQEIIASDPALIQAVVSGIAAGMEAKIKSMREEMSWTNMALDMALTMATQRVTPEVKRMAEHVIRKRLEAWGGGINGIEKAFLSSPNGETP
jgi:hypothetical protein